MNTSLKRCIFPGVCGVVTMIAAVLLYVAIFKDALDGYLKWYAAIIGLVCFLPAVICFAITRAVYSGVISVVASVGYTSLNLVISAFACLSIVIFMALICVNVMDDVTTDPADYREKYEKVEEVHGLFPEEIPANAENVIFNYCPQSWQGEKNLLLMYSTSDEDITAVESSLEGMTVSSGSLWELELGDRKKMRILLRSYFGLETPADSQVNAYVINGTESGDSTFSAVLTMPDTGSVAYIYYID